MQWLIKPHPSLNIDKMKAIINKLKNIRNQYFQYYQIDIADETNVQNVFEKINSNNAKIDVLINNAGITSDNILVRMSSQQWHNVINTNLNGCYYCCKAISKKMIKQKFGKIINISSIIGLIGNNGQANYAASKAGIIGLTKSLAKELGSRNINVNAINPGYIDTDMTKDLKNKLKFIENIPLNRYGKPEDVANLACFLASEKSSYITGQTINVDGGIVM